MECLLCKETIADEAIVCRFCGAYAVETDDEILWHRAGLAGWNGKAIASLVLALVWAFGLGSVAGLILAVQAVREIDRGGRVEKGRELAVVAGVIGAIGAFVPLFVAVSMVIQSRAALN